jgi:hypothetical protein
MHITRLIASLALLAGWASVAHTQDFRVEDVPSAANLAVEQLKPKTIAFADAPGEEALDAGTGFMRFEDWARVRPLQRELLTLYPGYAEPNVDLTVDGVKKRYREKLHMYVAEARVLLTRPAASLNLASFVTLPFAQKLDPAIKHRLITAADVSAPADPKLIHNQNPQRRWCEGREVAICLHSTYKLEGRLPVGIQLANKIRESSKKISDTLEFDSELTLLSPAEIQQRGLARLTGLDTPAIGAVEQSIFYVNQVMEFGKLLAIFQQHPTQADKTVATVFVALAIESNILTKRKEYLQIPVLRNMVPAQVLAGKSSFNTGSSLSAGLPVYARNQVKAIATILSGG